MREEGCPAFALWIFCESGTVWLLGGLRRSRLTSESGGDVGLLLIKKSQNAPWINWANDAMHACNLLERTVVGGEEQKTEEALALLEYTNGFLCP
jgi:hypothetical protein